MAKICSYLQSELDMTSGCLSIYICDLKSPDYLWSSSFSTVAGPSIYHYPIWCLASACPSSPWVSTKLAKTPLIEPLPDATACIQFKAWPGSDAGAESRNIFPTLNSMSTCVYNCVENIKYRMEADWLGTKLCGWIVYRGAITGLIKAGIGGGIYPFNIYQSYCVKLY